MKKHSLLHSRRRRAEGREPPVVIEHSSLKAFGVRLELHAEGETEKQRSKCPIPRVSLSLGQFENCC